MPYLGLVPCRGTSANCRVTAKWILGHWRVSRDKSEPDYGASLRGAKFLFQPTIMCRYFENATLPSRVTRTAREFRDRTIQPSSENRLCIAAPRVPAR
jgi:hypothetical protein